MVYILYLEVMYGVQTMGPLIINFTLAAQGRFYIARLRHDMILLGLAIILLYQIVLLD